MSIEKKVGIEPEKLNGLLETIRSLDTQFMTRQQIDDLFSGISVVLPLMTKGQREMLEKVFREKFPELKGVQFFDQKNA